MFSFPHGDALFVIVGYKAEVIVRAFGVTGAVSMQILQIDKRERNVICGF